MVFFGILFRNLEENQKPLHKSLPLSLSHHSLCPQVRNRTGGQPLKIHFFPAHCGTGGEKCLRIILDC